MQLVAGDRTAKKDEVFWSYFPLVSHEKYSWEVRLITPCSQALLTALYIMGMFNLFLLCFLLQDIVN